MQIIISNDVKSAITDIFEYSYNISANYANKIVNKIYDAIYDLQYSPYIGRYVPELLDKHYRERICEKYRIIYYVSQTNNTIYERLYAARKRQPYAPERLSFTMAYCFSYSFNCSMVETPSVIICVFKFGS